MTLHVATEQVPGILARLGVEVDGDGEGPAQLALLAVDHPVAAAIGDRLLIRVPSPPSVLGGGWIVDPDPPRIRTKAMRQRLADARGAIRADAPLAGLVAYRRALPRAELERSAAAVSATLGSPDDALAGAAVAGGLVLAPGIAERLQALARDHLASARTGLAAYRELRRSLAGHFHRLGGLTREDADLAAGAVLEAMTRSGTVELRGGLALDPQRGEGAAALAAAEARLLAALDSPRPPGLADAAREASYAMNAVSALVERGQLVRVAPNLAFAAPVYRRLERLALRMARDGTLSAASFRDAAATSRRHAVAVLDAMALAGMLRRDGERHVPGPRAPSPGAVHDRDPAVPLGGSR